MKSALNGALLAVALAASAAVQAKNKEQPPEPASHPAWGPIIEATVQRIKARLIDPGSAQIRWTSGFRWGYNKPMIGGRTYGWIACGAYNAKNRMGGYTGDQPFFAFVDEAGQHIIFDQDTWMNPCVSEPSAPLQPEMVDAGRAAEAGQGVLSVADEIGKLDGLRDKGIITEAEFLTQKAKLLAR